MPHRILILSAAVGGGHLRAAEAVELALRQLDPSAEVKNVDVLTLANAAFRALYGSAYLEFVNRAPHVLGYLYDLLDRPSGAAVSGDKMRLALEKLNLRPFTELLNDGRWDVVVNTHFLPAGIIAGERKKGKLALPQITVTTDFETHRLWVNEPCDLYTTATDEGAAYLAYWGVPRGHIRVTGIPIHPVFSTPKPRAQCLAAHGLAGDRPILLQLAGGFGVGPIAQLFQSILRIDTPLDVVVVAGKNADAKAELEKLPLPPQHRAGFSGLRARLMS